MEELWQRWYANEDVCSVIETMSVSQLARSFPPVMEGYTILHAACNRGDEVVANALLEKEGMLEAATESGFASPPLHLLLRYGASHLAILRAASARTSPLVRCARDARGDTSLLLACRRSLFEQIEILASSTELILTPGHDGLLPLHLAAQGRSVSVLRLFLEALTEEEMLTVSPKGETVLHMAAQQSHLDVCRLLVDLLPPRALSMQSNSGNTPLHEVKKFKEKVCKVFLSAMSPEQIAIRNKWGDLAVDSCRTDASRALFSRMPKGAMHQQ